MVEIWINIADGVLRTLLKSPKQVAKYRAALRRVRDTLMTMNLDA